MNQFKQSWYSWKHHYQNGVPIFVILIGELQVFGWFLESVIYNDRTLKDINETWNAYMHVICPPYIVKWKMNNPDKDKTNTLKEVQEMIKELNNETN